MNISLFRSRFSVGRHGRHAVSADHLPGRSASDPVSVVSGERPAAVESTRPAAVAAEGKRLAEQWWTNKRAAGRGFFFKIPCF